MDGSKKVGWLSVLAALGLGLWLTSGRTRTSPSTTSESNAERYEHSPQVAAQRDAVLADALTRDAYQQSLEAAVERSCGANPAAVYLAPQGPLDPLFTICTSLWLPAGVTTPPTFKVRGLTVRVMTGSANDGRHCVDVSQELVDSVASAGPTFPPEALQNVAPGVWLLKTQRDGVPAPAALMSDTFLRALGPTSLVAFAPADHVVAFADASNTAAIRAAAKHVVAAIDLDTTDTYTDATPLLFKDGVWSTWQSKDDARELRDARKLGEVLEARMVLAQLQNLADLAEWRSQRPVGLSPMAPLLFTDGVVARLDVDKALKTSVRLVPWEVTLLAPADNVIVGDDRPMAWKAFHTKHAGALQPVYVNGVLMPQVLRWAQ